MNRNHDLKEENLLKIRSCFYEKEIWTKSDLSKYTNISLAATTNILKELVEKEEILYIGDGESTGGRKSKNYTLNPEYTHIGLLILRKEGKTHIMHAMSMDLRGKVYCTFQEKKEYVFVQDIYDLVDILIQSDSKVQVLCISIPGVSENGIIEICDYQEIVGVDLYNSLQKRTNKIIIIENDVNVACIGFSKKYPETKHIAFIYQPKEDYVGVGIVLNRVLYNGFSHFAGELRYCPFYTHHQQEEMTKENPQDLLLRQMGILCTVLNPEIIGYHSDCFKEVSTSLETYGIPKKHCPKLICVEHLENEIQNGLFSIGINYVKMNRSNKNEN